MNALNLAAALFAAALIPGGALAQDSLRLGDVDVVQHPHPAHYRPDSTDYDLADRGKTFDILCTVNTDGRMQDCTAQPNNLADQNFVRIGVDNARYFVIARAAHDGSATAGRVLSLTCRFDPADGDGTVERSLAEDGAAQAVADDGHARTDVAAR